LQRFADLDLVVRSTKTIGVVNLSLLLLPAKVLYTILLLIVKTALPIDIFLSYFTKCTCHTENHIVTKEVLSQQNGQVLELVARQGLEMVSCYVHGFDRTNPYRTQERWRSEQKLPM
jgi:hypothetical protein